MTAPRTTLEALRLAEWTRPGATQVRWRGGSATVAAFTEDARTVARGLRAAGVRSGDRVAVMAANSYRFLTLWYGIYLSGAVEVPVNSELRGPLLAHVLTDSDPALVLAESPFLDRIRAVAPPGLRVVELEDAVLAAWAGAPAIEEADPAPGDLATIMYTSGTTGPSKGVMLSHGYYANLGRIWTETQRFTSADVLYFMLPLFHIDSHVVFAASLLSGAPFAFAPRFSASQFWSDVEEFRATWFVAVGFMFAVLARQEAPPPARIPLRRGMGGPVPAEAYQFFEDRLGIPIYEIYGQTEADGVTFGTPERRRRGSTGWACSGFDVVILGPRGEHLPPGATGEIAYRPSGANMMLQGYWRRDEATVEACRDLWFRSGDLGYLGADSFLWFVGRMRDVLRRRGENISAFELETAVRNAPGVTDCAATAVRDPLGGEDEVKLFLALQDPTTFDAAAFFAWCDEHLPRFAVPRYVEIVDAALFVRSAGNGSIQKHLLPAGLGPATIDRLASQRP